MAGADRENVPLRRNRDFMLLQTGQLLSSVGTQSSAIAYPLLVLAITHSPTQTGVVAFARAVPLAVFALPAGVAADQWSRKRLMIAADAVRLVAIGALALLIATHHVALWHIVVVALVEGTGAAVFTAAQSGAVRATVPTAQLQDAAAALSGRDAAVQLAGPPLGGVLFGIGSAIPFAADCASYTCSTASLLAMRTPFEEQRVPSDVSMRARLAEGFWFQWRNPFLRTTTLLFSIANFIAPGLLFAVVVIGREGGASSLTVGALLAAFSVCMLIGSFASARLRRGLPTHVVMLLELFAWCGCAAFLVWPDVYALTIALLPAAFVIPSTDAVVHGTRLALTPDHLVGRAESVRRAIAVSIAPFGPLVAGVLLAHSARAAIAVFAVSALALALWATLSPALRDPPRVGAEAA